MTARSSFSERGGFTDGCKSTEDTRTLCGMDFYSFIGYAIFISTIASAALFVAGGFMGIMMLILMGGLFLVPLGLFVGFGLGLIFERLLSL